MKKIIFAVVLLIGVLITTRSDAQQRDSIPDNCSWQLVSNILEKSKVTVQFYTGEGVLMYEETLYNTKLNINRKKTVRHLNAVMQQVYNNWVMNNSNGKDLIAKRIK
ncbi:MAG TPA: hypothetical protein VFZ47_11765 [Chitinophagaceae bacterium]